MRNLNFMNGLQIMKFSISHLETENVMPTYEEIKVFMANQKDPEYQAVMRESLRILNDPSKRLQQNLIRGDRVRATTGEFKSLVGVVIDITSDFIKVDFSGQQPGLKDAVLFKPQEIQKNFDIGEKVEILVGKRKGTTGRVIKLEEHVVHVVTENSNEEVAILSSDLRRNDGLGMGNKRIFKRQAGLNKFDLVTFNNSRSVGLVLRVGVGTCAVLDTEGCSRSFQMVQINNKLTKTYVGKNAYNQEIKVKYTVKVLSGRNKSRLTRQAGAREANLRQGGLPVQQKTGAELGDLRGKHRQLLGHQQVQLREHIQQGQVQQRAHRQVGGA